VPSFSVSTIASAGADSPGMVVVRGELDISGVGQVRRALTDVENGPAAVVALDLREVEHLDSSALRLLLDAEDRARRRGCRFVVVAGPDGAVARLLALTMLADHVEVVSDLVALRG
jgi:anti-anti-sigma factor